MEVSEKMLEHANKLLATLRRVDDWLPGARIRMYNTALPGLPRIVQEDLFQLLIRTGFVTVYSAERYEVVPFGTLTLADLIDMSIGEPTPYERRTSQLARGVSAQNDIAWAQRFPLAGDVWWYKCWRYTVARLHVHDYEFTDRGVAVVLAEPISYRPELAIPGSTPVAAMTVLAVDAFRLFVERRQLILVEVGSKKGSGDDATASSGAV